MKIINILRATVVLVGLSVFLFLFTIILPFLVQERLVILLAIVVLSITFFNGRVCSDRNVTYKINIEESE
ncbi:hypothetical protein I580_02678 [Enterococcus caccae ATCC BAA-1240]|uniref:Uncharacterized protein n=1 Tax=Enterococcus caccae ATCC BAA-1240 TaxID=1158612 RepID=R3WTG2_9ENTE|nr:hypothetical protein UC7_01906 [Enterococcus caccae ATCC BAA-1240]EOT58507.1 hypothetical protein I580_02678 [Enterococcus caccae ATCC BAA-1240]